MIKGQERKIEMVPTTEDKHDRITRPIVVRSNEGSSLSSVRKPTKEQSSSPWTLFGFFDREGGINIKTTLSITNRQIYSPRHKHTFEQVRYLIRGTQHYGKEVYGAGTCIYVPEGVPYEHGPMQTMDGVERAGIGMQFAGPSGIPFPYRSDITIAQDELEKLGTIDKGVFKWADGRTQDSFEAILEHLIGRKVEYPKARYSDYIVMRTENYRWVPLKDVSGVFVKHLGYFNETGPNIKLVKIEAGARTLEGVAPCQQVRGLVEGDIFYEGEQYEAVSCMYFPAHVPYFSTKSTNGATLLVVQLASPTGDAPPACLI